MVCFVACRVRFPFNRTEGGADSDSSRHGGDSAHGQLRECGGGGAEGRVGTGGEVGKGQGGVDGSRCFGDVDAGEKFCGEGFAGCGDSVGGRSDEKEKEEEEEEGTGEDPGERYDGELLVLAERLGRRLLPAFETPTGVATDGLRCVGIRLDLLRARLLVLALGGPIKGRNWTPQPIGKRPRPLPPLGITAICPSHSFDRCCVGVI